MLGQKRLAGAPGNFRIVGAGVDGGAGDPRGVEGGDLLAAFLGTAHHANGFHHPAGDGGAGGGPVLVAEARLEGLCLCLEAEPLEEAPVDGRGEIAPDELAGSSPEIPAVR